MELMELKEARKIAERIRTKDWDINKSVEMFNVAIILDDRVAKLEVVLKIEREVARRAISRARYTHRLIKQMEQRYELHIKELKAQRDELLKACKAIMNSNRCKSLSVEVVIQTMEAIEKGEGVTRC